MKALTFAHELSSGYVADTLVFPKGRCKPVPVRAVPLHSQFEYAATLLEHIRPNIDWLDIGCGRQVVPDWVLSTERARDLLGDANLTGLDVDDAIAEHPLLKKRLRCRAENIPVPDDSFDLVTANMVVEHIPEPGGLLREIWRVLRPGGSFLVHTPNLRFYMTRIARRVPEFIKKRVIYWLEHREDKDIFPTYHRFNTLEAIERYAGESGFYIERLRFAGPTPSFLDTPLEALERPLINLLRRPAFKRYRSNLIVELKKPGSGVSMIVHSAGMPIQAAA
jgi:ubiquinone/menaquinone biosynthesis C-methylase UbiE